MATSRFTSAKVRPLRVLVVDDQDGVRALLKRFLGQEGHLVFEAENGLRAIELVGEGGFDLCLIDVRMPGLNGLETLRGIRRIDLEARVVMMTGYAVEDLLENIRAEGVVDILAKPFDLSRLRDVIAEASDHRRSFAPKDRKL